MLNVKSDTEINCGQLNALLPIHCYEFVLVIIKDRLKELDKQYNRNIDKFM